MPLFDNRLAQLDDAIENAQTYAEYREACEAHDELSGADEWKDKDPCRDYDYRLIRKRVQRIKLARGQGDIQALISIIHEGLHGNLANISNPVLLNHSKLGTKTLIQDFIDQVVGALDQIYAADENEIDFYEKLSFFDETAHAFGRTCLMLSGGAGLGFFHCGVVKSLNERNLLPGVVSGASAGSIIAAMLATRTQEELLDVLDAEFIYSKFRDWRLFKGFGGKSLFDSSKLENALIELFDVMTFEEAFKRTGLHVTITVSPADLHQHSRLLNAKTSPNAIITQAVRASCAVPIVFSPVQLRAKATNGDIVPYIPNRRFADGSVMADLPFERLARLYGVNHSIVSQTNPIAVPFLSRNRKNTHNSMGITMRHISNLAKVNSIYAFDMLESAISNRGAKLAIHKVRSIIDQQYVGDINVLPEQGVRSLAHLWSNPTVDSISELISNGERATWPQLDHIERSTHISQTLRRYLKQLKEREARVLANNQNIRLVESKSA